MKAFAVGLLTIIVVLVLSAVAILLLPLFLVLAFFLRIIVGMLFVLVSIWLLGKFVLWIWKYF